MPKVSSVCEVLSSPNDHDGKVIIISATVIGDRHSVVLKDEDCEGGIFMIHKWGQEGAVWKALDSALTRKSTGLDKRTLRVRVSGVFHSAVSDGDRRIRQLEVTDVLEVKFDDDKKIGSEVKAQPSTHALLHESGHVDPPNPH